MVNNNWTKIKKAWNWTWNSDSILSWFVALAVIFIFVKFIFFPVLSLSLGTSLPLAGVESSSMEHQITKDGFGFLNICGRYDGEDKYLNFENFWKECGEWYEEREIDQETFKNFPLKNGFNKGDIVLVYGRFNPKLGDVIVFSPNKESLAPRPIVHRITNIKEENSEIIIETKGDHNSEQLTQSNNRLKTDETNIKEDQIIGKVIFRIPYLGWVKIWFSILLNTII